jgi:AcrR family transcriptional regulator
VYSGYGRQMPKVTEEHRASKRADILDAARRCFASNGFHATSMQDILDESAMSAGAVYRYFPGKSEIVAAIADENVTAVLETMNACTQDAADRSVADVLITALAGVRAKDDAHATAAVAVQVWAESARDPALRQQFVTTHERFRKVLAALIRRRHPELDDDADAVSGALGAIVPGFILQLGLLDDERTRDFETGVRYMLGDL